MNVLSIQDIEKSEKVATIGMFDGVHNGHKFLINTMVREARNKKLSSLVVTFTNHPMLFFKPECGLKLLSLKEEKLSLLDDAGVDNCLMLDFNSDIQRLTSADFITLLRDNFGITELIVGYDHHFGSDKITDFESYKRIGKKLGVEIFHCDAFTENSVEVSSSKIRKALQNGDISLANKYLDYKYSVSGVVENGFKIGRTLGFPTANININKAKLLPKEGVYIVSVRICDMENSSDLQSINADNISKQRSIVSDTSYFSKMGVENNDSFSKKEFSQPSAKFIPAMMNIGRRPTFNGEEVVVEVHLINFSENLYDKGLQIIFEKFLREEIRFDSSEKLREQLQKDYLETKSYFGID